MPPNISEFSYGFALTSELISSPGLPLTASPVFPNLYSEGQPGGGWDVRLDRPGLPLFLQFKLSHRMERRNCKEVRDGIMDVPCYRFHLRPRHRSQQHEMLIDLESQDQEVYYCAPAFHEPPELNEAFLSQEVRNRSAWVRPSAIGPITDDDEHHVSFNLLGALAMFSKAKIVQSSHEFTDAGRSIEIALKRRGDRALKDENLRSLSEVVASIAEKRQDVRPLDKVIARDKLANSSPLMRVAYYASVYFDSQMFVVQQKE